MKNYIQAGKTLTVAAPAGGVTSGQLVVVGSLIGVASTTQAVGEDVELDVEGVFELPKVAGDNITVGEKLYWNGAALTDTPGYGLETPCGLCHCCGRRRCDRSALQSDPESTNGGGVTSWGGKSFKT